MTETRRLWWVAVLAIFATLPWSQEAAAWGDLGHELVCEIAFQELQERSTTARDEVLRLIALDDDFSTFAKSCTWPDHPKTRRPEHYVNVPRSYYYIGAANCGQEPRCIFSAIAEDRYELSRTSIPDREKLERLKYLGHWVGDIHQPLHVSFQDDRGGGQIEEAGNECAGDWNLHSVWDTCLVQKRVLDGNVKQTAEKLRARVTDNQRKEWAAANVVDWADESFKIAIEEEVGYCVSTRDSQGRSRCSYDTHNPYLDPGEPKKSVLIDSDYLDQHAGTAKERILQAGIRLGALLASTFDPEAWVD